MLAEVLGGARHPEIVELPVRALQSPRWRTPARGQGFLVLDQRASGVHTAHRLDDAWLNHASDSLRQEGKFLVVVTGPLEGILASAVHRFRYVVGDLALPDPLQIVRKKVASAVPEVVGRRFDELVEQAHIVDVLAERDDPHFATRVAHAVVESVRAGADPRLRVARLRNPHEQVAEWLDQFKS